MSLQAETQVNERVPPDFRTYAKDRYKLRTARPDEHTLLLIDAVADMLDWREDWEAAPKETAFDWEWPFANTSNDRDDIGPAIEALRMCFVRIRDAHLDVVSGSVDRFIMAQLINTGRELIMQARILGAAEE